MPMAMANTPFDTPKRACSWLKMAPSMARPPAPAVLRGPGDAGPSPAGQHALPLAAALHVLLFGVVGGPHAGREVVGVALRDGVGLEPGARLGAEGRLLGGVVEVHRPLRLEQVLVR